MSIRLLIASVAICAVLGAVLKPAVPVTEVPATVSQLRSEAYEDNVTEGYALLTRVIYGPNASVTMENRQKLKATSNEIGKSQIENCAVASTLAWGQVRGFTEPQILPSDVRTNILTACLMFVDGASHSEAESMLRKAMGSM